MEVLKFKSYHDPGDKSYLVLALIQDEGIYYVVHKIIFQASLTKSQIKKFLEKGVYYKDKDIDVFKLFTFGTLSQAKGFYTQSLG